ncbi:MAG: helix-turn-helix transcriptional regulator [Oscillospiraceae bacterium]|nr:helix-turn-helix transcriptional regulator [Oscillospiraceae bacterium]
MGQIILRLDRVMADRKISLKELADRVGISNVNLSKIKTGKVCAIRFSTLSAICEVLNCQPGDILEYDQSLDGNACEETASQNGGERQ